MLERLFTSRTRVKILTLFMMNPGEDFFLREIARRTQENINSVRRELQNLEQIGILRSSRRGNMKYFSIQTDFPIFPELRSIIMKTVGMNKILKDRLNKISGIKLAFIYGSFASGEANQYSDLDLLIVGDVDEDLLIREISSEEENISREINYLLYSNQEFRKELEKENSFLMNVLKNPKIIIIGELDVG